MSNTQSDTENTHSPPCVRSVQASTCICMNTDRQMHTHGNTGKATFIQTQRRRWVTAPKLALRCTSLFLLPPPPPSPFSLLGWGAPWRHLSLSKGVKALRWEPSQLVWRRLGSQLAAGRPPPAAHGCHSDEKTFGGTYFQNTIMEILLLFFFWPVCWKAAQLLVPLRCAFFILFFDLYYFLFNALISPTLLPLPLSSLLSLILAFPPCQASMLWYPSFSVSAAMTHVPIHPPLSTLLEVYSKSSRNKHGLFLPIENFLLDKPSRHSTGRIFGLFKRIPSWISLIQSRQRV